MKKNKRVPDLKHLLIASKANQDQPDYPNQIVFIGNNPDGYVSVIVWINDRLGRSALFYGRPGTRGI